MSNRIIRLDRILSLSGLGAAAHLMDRRRVHGVPILMYHAIQPALTARHPYFETNTSPEVFEQQMRFLKANGFASLDLPQAIQRIRMGQSVEQAVVITFDDGYRDFYTHAFGVLAELKMTATVFAISGLTGKSREGRDYLSARELREIHGRGMRIGSHTISHPHLHGMASAAVEVELRQSRFDLEDTIGGPVQSFSYPYAFPEQDRQFTSGLRKMLVNSGYENGVSTILGRAGKGDDPIFLPRVPISSYDDHRLFRAKLEGKYDWVRLGQIVYKHLRGRSPSSSKSAIAIAGGLE